MSFSADPAILKTFLCEVSGVTDLDPARGARWGSAFQMLIELS